MHPTDPQLPARPTPSSRPPLPDPDRRPAATRTTPEATPLLPPVTRWILAAAALLRLVHVRRASLHLDDFHTLHHAGAADWGAFFSGLRADNHPPLVPGLVRLLERAFGDAELAGRLVQVAGALLVVWLAGRLALRITGARGRHLAEALVAVSALHVELSTDLRMYGALALVGVLLFDAALRVVERRAGWLRTAVVVALGLHTHYHFVHALGGTVLVVAGASLAGRLHRASVARFGLGVLAGILLWLPWGVLGFWHQVTAHALAPGTSHVDPLRIVQGLVHLLFHRTGLLGGWTLAVFGPLALVGGGLAVHGIVQLGREPRSGPRAALLAWSSAGLVAWSGLAAWISPRAGFEWRYLAGALVPFLLALVHGLVHAPLGARLARAVALALVGASTVLATRVAWDPGREDYRGAVAAVLAEARPGDGVLAADWQPRIFPRGIGWRWYAPRLAQGSALPERIDHTPDFELEAGALEGFERVFVVTRSVPGDAPLFRTLGDELERHRATRFGEAVWLVEYRQRGVAALGQGR